MLIWYLQSAWRTRAWELDRARRQMPPPIEWSWLGGRSFLRSSFTKLSPVSISGSDLVSSRKDFLISCIFSPWFWVCFLIVFVCLFGGFVSVFPLFICEALWRRIDWIYGRWVWPRWAKLVFLGIIERTFLNRLAHHLQLHKDHFRDTAVHFNSPETMKSKVCCPVCRWSQYQTWQNITSMCCLWAFTSGRRMGKFHLFFPCSQRVGADSLKLAQSEMAELAKVRIPDGKKGHGKC